MHRVSPRPHYGAGEMSENFDFQISVRGPRPNGDVELTAHLGGRTRPVLIATVHDDVFSAKEIAREIVRVWNKSAPTRPAPSPKGEP